MSRVDLYGLKGSLWHCSILQSLDGQKGCQAKPQLTHEINDMQY